MIVCDGVVSEWFTMTGASCSTIIGRFRPLEVDGFRYVDAAGDVYVTPSIEFADTPFWLRDMASVGLKALLLDDEIFCDVA